MTTIAKTETIVREYDTTGRLVSEQVTTVEDRPVVLKPPGFAPLAAPAACEHPGAPREGG